MKTLIAVVVVLLLAGCGDPSSSTISSPHSTLAPSQSAQASSPNATEVPTTASSAANDFVAEPSTSPVETPIAEEPLEEALDPQFDTCGDANDAGYGNYRQGTDPEYDWYRDRDKDGVACEM